MCSISGQPHGTKLVSGGYAAIKDLFFRVFVSELLSLQLWAYKFIFYHPVYIIIIILLINRAPCCWETARLWDAGTEAHSMHNCATLHIHLKNGTGSSVYEEWYRVVDRMVVFDWKECDRTTPQLDVVQFFIIIILYFEIISIPACV